MDTNQGAPADWRERSTINVWPDAAALLGIGRVAAYTAANAGQIPTLRVGRRLVVPVAKLRRQLGEIE